MCILYHPGTCNELMMKCLIALLRFVRNLVYRSLKSLDGSCRKNCTEGHGACIDLVKGKPVLNLILISFKQHVAISLKEFDELSSLPAVVLLYKVVRKLIMRNSYQWLNAVLFTAVKYPVIKLKALLVRLCFLACWEDTGPVDGSTEAFESHFCKEGNVFLVVMIKINGLM